MPIKEINRESRKLRKYVDRKMSKEINKRINEINKEHCERLRNVQQKTDKKDSTRSPDENTRAARKMTT